MVQSRIRASRRAASRLPERKRGDLTISDGEEIARATGVVFQFVGHADRKDGGGVLYEFTLPAPDHADQVGGLGGRDALVVAPSDGGGFEIVR